jgi:hypothetical protein
MAVVSVSRWSLHVTSIGPGTVALDTEILRSGTVSTVGSSSIIAFLNCNDGTKVRGSSSFPLTEMTGQPGRSSSLERTVGDAGSSTTQPINATQEQGPPNQVESAGMQARPSSQRLSLDSAQSVGSTKQRASETKTETKRRRSLMTVENERVSKKT